MLPDSLNSRVVFTELREDHSIVWEALPERPGDRRELARVEHAPHFGLAASLSPAGTRLAYVRVPPHACDPDLQGEVWVDPLDGSPAQMVAVGADVRTAPLWSPDGTRLLYAATSGALPDRSDYRTELHVVGASARPARVAAGQAIRPVGWSADGERVYFTDLTGAGTDLLEIMAPPPGSLAVGATPASPLPDALPARPRPLAHLSDGLARDLRLAPDGERLLFVAPPAGVQRAEWSIVSLSLAGGTAEVLRTGPEEYLQPTWRTGRSEVTYAALAPTSPGELGVRSLALDTRVVQKTSLPSPAGFDVPLDWSSDGRYLAARFFRGTPARIESEGLAILDPATGGRRDVLAAGYLEFVGWRQGPPARTPDGREDTDPASLLSVFPASSSPILPLADCANLNANAYQPQLAEADDAFRRAAAGQLAEPALPQIKVGSSSSTSYAQRPVPCTVTRAIGWIESGWRQAGRYADGRVVPRGETGPALTAYSGCAYGIMQIASGMQPGVWGELSPETKMKIASDYRFNIGWGTKMLVDKWNWVPGIGERNPSLIEDWYYAVWAYNWWAWKNNPNNPAYPWPRAPYNGIEDWGNYPYQELVWGVIQNPPRVNGQPLWPAVPVTLPDRGLFPTHDQTSPGPIPDPFPVHGEFCTAALSLNPTTLSFVFQPGGPTPTAQVLAVDVVGGGSLSWQASSNAGWVLASPLTGTGPTTLRVAITPPATPGRYAATITIAANPPAASTQQVNVSLYVGPLRRVAFPEVFKAAWR